MDKATDARVKRIRKELGELVCSIGERRNRLRALASELDDILETVTRGNSSISAALRDLDAGIDELSELL